MPFSVMVNGSLVINIWTDCISSSGNRDKMVRNTTQIKSNPSLSSYANFSPHLRLQMSVCLSQSLCLLHFLSLSLPNLSLFCLSFFLEAHTYWFKTLLGFHYLWQLYLFCYSWTVFSNFSRSTLGFNKIWPSAKTLVVKLWVLTVSRMKTPMSSESLP